MEESGHSGDRRLLLRVVRHLPQSAELSEWGVAGRAGVGQASREETARELVGFNEAASYGD
jgi:hypothetical protein